ncbi:GTP cyclohydrolase I FolE [Rickettsiales bacterium]|nr:GTP cyclohydrolase I FolE [Rickettsiales bacterium]
MSQAGKAISQVNNIMSKKPTREEAKAAVRTLIAWAGDDPDREGLIDTPSRVVDAYNEFFCGYNDDPKDILSKTFEDVQGYDDIVLLKNMRLESHCEHHMVPILGKAHIAYLPNSRVVGISKIARLLDVFSKRLQTQETMTAQVAEVINEVLEPKGVAVLIDAKHQCMTTRGVHKTETTTVTNRMLGVFKDDPAMQEKFFKLIGSSAIG